MTTEEIREASGRLKKTTARETEALTEHKANVALMEASRAHIADLESMDAPTPASITEEAAARRHLAKLEFRGLELTQALEFAREARLTAESDLQSARHAKTVADLEAEWGELVRDAVAFDADFRARLAEHQAKASAAGLKSWQASVLSPRDEGVLAECVRQQRYLELVEGRRRTG